MWPASWKIHARSCDNVLPTLLGLGLATVLYIWTTTGQHTPTPYSNVNTCYRTWKQLDFDWHWFEHTASHHIWQLGASTSQSWENWSLERQRICPPNRGICSKVHGWWQCSKYFPFRHVKSGWTVNSREEQARFHCWSGPSGVLISLRR